MSIYDMLYPYQREAADQIVVHHRKALFDDPGLGKTITVLGALEQAQLFSEDAPGNTLVLATRTGAALTWLPHAEKLVPKNVHIIDGVRRTIGERRRLANAAARDDRPALVIANHNLLDLTATQHDWEQGQLWDVEWDAIIVDESQRVLPTRAEHDLAQTQFWRGLRRLKAPEHAIRVPMSGTPDRGKLENRYGTWAFMLPEVYNFEGGTPYEEWVNQTFKLMYKPRYIRVRGRLIEQNIAIVTGIRKPEQWKAMDEAMTIRRTKAEVAPQLPRKRYIDVEVPFTPSQERAYIAFLDEFSKSDDGSKNSADTFMIRATQFGIVEHTIQHVPGPGNRTVGHPKRHAKSPKLDWIIEWMEERGYDAGENDGKVVITSQFKQVLLWLKAELEDLGVPGIALLTGDMSTNERLSAQRQFQDPRSGVDIMLLSMNLGDSIDLDAADDMIFIDRVHDPDRVTQAEDRVHRVSRIHNVVIWRLITVGSVDEAIDRVNEKRFDTTRRVMDGNRGVDYARQVLARYAA